MKKSAKISQVDLGVKVHLMLYYIYNNWCVKK